MTKYYKAVREDYTDFFSGEIDYSVGNIVKHPEPGPHGDCDAEGYLSVSTDPTDIPGASAWPLRMLEVEAEDGWESPGYDHKVCTHELTVTGEIEAWKYFGPNGEQVLRMSEQASDLSGDESAELYARLKGVRGYESYRVLRYQLVYLFKNRMSAYDVRDLVGHGYGYELSAVTEGLSLLDFLNEDQQAYVGELISAWDAFFDRTPTQKVFARIRNFFRDF